MLLGTLGASLLGNLLTGGKGIMRAGDGGRLILLAAGRLKKYQLDHNSSELCVTCFALSFACFCDLLA